MLAEGLDPLEEGRALSWPIGQSIAGLVGRQGAMTPSAIAFDRERPCPCRDETILLIAPAGACRCSSCR